MCQCGTISDAIDRLSRSPYSSITARTWQVWLKPHSIPQRPSDLFPSPLYSRSMAVRLSSQQQNSLLITKKIFSNKRESVNVASKSRTREYEPLWDWPWLKLCTANASGKPAKFEIDIYMISVHQARVTSLGYMEKWHFHVDLRWHDYGNIKDRLRVYTYVLIVIFSP